MDENFTIKSAILVDEQYLTVWWFDLLRRGGFYSGPCLTHQWKGAMT